MSEIQLFNLDGIDYRVETSSMEDLIKMIKPEDRKQGVRNIIATSGCYALYLSQEAIQVAADAVVGDYREEILATPPGFMICLIKEFTQFLSQAELEAVLYHEIGHIRSGHLDPENTQGRSGIIVSLENEIQADDFMAARTDPRNLFTGIQKVFANISDFIYSTAKKNGREIDPHALYEELLREPQLVARKQRFGL